jgi:HEAT repeat protein
MPTQAHVEALRRAETPEIAVPETCETSLAKMVRDFAQDAHGKRGLIHDLLKQDRPRFLSAAIRLLKIHERSRGTEYLISLLVFEDLLVAALCDAELTPRQALSLARAAHGADPQVESAMARELAAATLAGDSERARRLMDILSQISDGTRILPWLMRLLRHSNPYLRSKAILLVARGSRNVKPEVRKGLSEPDARVRANAVGSLGGIDSEEVRGLLRAALRDVNNRVVGNAMLSLYRLGDRLVVPDLVEMAGHASAAFRATAAWVMGETGDPSFPEVLAGMLNDPSVTTRKRVFAALGRLRAAAKAGAAGEGGSGG